MTSMGDARTGNHPARQHFSSDGPDLRRILSDSFSGLNRLFVERSISLASLRGRAKGGKRGVDAKPLTSSRRLVLSRGLKLCDLTCETSVLVRLRHCLASLFVTFGGSPDGK